jgi:hypothetical protein
MSVQYGGDKITFSDGSTVGNGWSGMKNRIINGQMVVDQRNAGASVTLNSGTVAYTLDRYGCNNQSGGNITVQQSTTAPAGFQNSLLVTVTSANSPTSAQFGRLFQGIEGFNMSDLSWGTANAQSVTMSFWVRSSVTGTHSMVLNNGAGSYAYPFTFTINVANTFEYKTVTIAGPTAGTWGTNNNAFCYLSIPFGSGSSTTATAGVWASASDFINGATGSVNLIATSGATFYITGVQLEKGSTATSFDYRPYGTELALCQRYYFQTGKDSAYSNFGVGYNEGTTQQYNSFSLKQTMRAKPTLTTTGTASNYQILQNASAVTLSAVPVLDALNMTTDTAFITSGASGLSAGQGSMLRANNNTVAFLGFSAEL